MKFTALIPTRRNDGSVVDAMELQHIVEGLWRQFGGATIEGYVEGHWIDEQDARHYQDTGLKISVVCDASRLHEAEQAVIEIGKRLGQIAMYFEVQNFDGVRFLRIDS